MKNEAEVYLKIVNAGGEDRLLGAQVSLAGAAAEIQEMQGMIMVIRKDPAVSAHQTAAFQGMGSHIVIGGLPADLDAGARFTLSLDFEKSGKISVPLTFTMARPRQTQPSLSQK